MAKCYTKAPYLLVSGEKESATGYNPRCVGVAQWFCCARQ
jgi:hypothetical protein